MRGCNLNFWREKNHRGIRNQKLGNVKKFQVWVGWRLLNKRQVDRLQTFYIQPSIRKNLIHFHLLVWNVHEHKENASLVVIGGINNSLSRNFPKGLHFCNVHDQVYMWDLPRFLSRTFPAFEDLNNLRIFKQIIRNLNIFKLSRVTKAMY